MLDKEEVSATDDNAAHYGYWRALYKSFYSAPLYVDVAKRWKGWGIGYLLFCIVLASIPLSVRVMVNFNQFFEKQMLAPINKLPVLYVSHGGVLFTKPMPYLIKNKDEQVISIIDTTGAVETITDVYPRLTVLVTKNTIYFRPPDFKQFLGVKNSLAGNKVFSYSFEPTYNGVFVAESWIRSSGINKFSVVGLILVFPAIILFFLIVYVCFMLVIAALGQFCAGVFAKVRLEFKDVCRLLVVASTPQIVFFFVVNTANLFLPGLGFYSLMLVIIYFGYAVLSIKRLQA